MLSTGVDLLRIVLDRARQVLEGAEPFLGFVGGAEPDVFGESDLDRCETDGLRFGIQQVVERLDGAFGRVLEARGSPGLCCAATYMTLCLCSPVQGRVAQAKAQVGTRPLRTLLTSTISNSCFIYPSPFQAAPKCALCPFVVGRSNRTGPRSKSLHVTARLSVHDGPALTDECGCVPKPLSPRWRRLSLPPTEGKGSAARLGDRLGVLDSGGGGVSDGLVFDCGQSAESVL